MRLARAGKYPAGDLARRRRTCTAPRSALDRRVRGISSARDRYAVVRARGDSAALGTESDGSVAGSRARAAPASRKGNRKKALELKGFAGSPATSARTSPTRWT